MIEGATEIRAGNSSVVPSRVRSTASTSNSPAGAFGDTRMRHTSVETRSADGQFCGSYKVIATTSRPRLMRNSNGSPGLSAAGSTV